MTDRLAAKSVEGMEMRLQQMSSSQRERLAADNAEVRLQHDRENHRERRVQETLGGQLHLPLIQQCAVQAKMQKFHAHMEVSPTHRIICLPLLTWNDTGLGDPHTICDHCFFICSCMAISISDHNLRSCHCNNSIMYVYCALAQARPTMSCICLVILLSTCPYPPGTDQVLS